MKNALLHSANDCLDPYCAFNSGYATREMMHDCCLDFHSLREEAVATSDLTEHLLTIARAYHVAEFYGVTLIPTAELRAERAELPRHVVTKLPPLVGPWTGTPIRRFERFRRDIESGIPGLVLPLWRIAKLFDLPYRQALDFWSGFEEITPGQVRALSRHSVCPNFYAIRD